MTTDLRIIDYLSICLFKQTFGRSRDLYPQRTRTTFCRAVLPLKRQNEVCGRLRSSEIRGYWHDSCQSLARQSDSAPTLVLVVGVKASFL